MKFISTAVTLALIWIIAILNGIGIIPTSDIVFGVCIAVTVFILYSTYNWEAAEKECEKEIKEINTKQGRRNEK